MDFVNSAIIPYLNNHKEKAADDANSSEKDEYLEDPLYYTPAKFQEIRNYHTFFDFSSRNGIELMERNSQSSLSKKKCSNLTNIDKAVADDQFDNLSPSLEKEGMIQDSLTRINELSILPTEKSRKKSGRTYLNSHVTMIDLNSFLEPHMTKLDYAGASFSMSTNQIYDRVFTDQLFTVIYFKKNEKSSMQIFWDEAKKVGECCHILAPSEKGWLERKKELEDYISQVFSEWGYASFKMGNVNEDFLSESKVKSDYELYLLLFYKCEDL